MYAYNPRQRAGTHASLWFLDKKSTHINIIRVYNTLNEYSEGEDAQKCEDGVPPDSPPRPLLLRCDGVITCFHLVFAFEERGPLVVGPSGRGGRGRSERSA